MYVCVRVYIYIYIYIYIYCKCFLHLGAGIMKSYELDGLGIESQQGKYIYLSPELSVKELVGHPISNSMGTGVLLRW